MNLVWWLLLGVAWSSGWVLGFNLEAALGGPMPDVRLVVAPEPQWVVNKSRWMEGLRENNTSVLLADFVPNDGRSIVVNPYTCWPETGNRMCIRFRGFLVPWNFTGRVESERLRTLVGKPGVA